MPRKSHFVLDEFNLTGAVIPKRVQQSIQKNHIAVMNPVRDELGAVITVSKKSGWRPEEYEKRKKRSGNSTHTFKIQAKDPEGKGAADYTADDIERLLQLMIDKTGFNRICYYPNNKFIHADYAYPERGRRLFHAASPAAEWKFIKEL
tara:strand:+ start:15870 stop:16313 length:444 start_codon:yes stop_codon:yes gene_type:complete